MVFVVIDGCKSAFLVQAKWFKTAYPLFSNQSNVLYAPVVLDWGIQIHHQPISPFQWPIIGGTTTPSTIVLIVLFQRVTQIAQVLHVIAQVALKEIPIFLEDVKVRFL